jgi:uncharacterized protein
VLAIGLLLASALPAAAHVDIVAPAAEPGTVAELAVQVPNESTTAGTVKVRLVLPTDQRLTSVQVTPAAGWTAETVLGADGEVSEVTWTADDAVTAIPPGGYGQFFLEARLPNAARVAFQAIQTAGDGTVTRWVEPTVSGAAEPEHPAPVLSLLTAAEINARPTSAPVDRAGTPWWLLALGGQLVLGLVAAVVLSRRPRRRGWH